MTQKQKFLLALIVFLAVFFRFYLIAQMPGGLFPDMAANGLDVNLMQEGHLQPFYERGNGREALFFYMEWASVALFNKGVWQFSIVSALVGVLSVLVCFAVTRRLFMMGQKNREPGSAYVENNIVPATLRSVFSRMHGNAYDTLGKSSFFENRATNIALLAAFLMAVNSWHVVLSRTAFRANLIPLFAGLTIYFLIRTYQAFLETNESGRVPKSAWLFSAFTGAAFALGFYTYIAYRILAVIIGLAVFWPWVFNSFGAQIKKYWKAAVLFLLAFIIFIYPLANYFYKNPGAFIGRSGQVSVFNPDLYLTDGQQLHGKPPAMVAISALAEVTKTSLLAFFTQGDLNWRHNISGQPFLSQLVSPFFGAGLFCITLMAIAYIFMPRKKVDWWKYFLLAGWFWGMLVPVVTTAEGIPHGLRSIGMIPPVFIISAWALYKFGELVFSAHEKIWHRCRECYRQYYESSSGYFRRSLAKWALKLAVLCFFIALILQTYFMYFVYAYNSAENFYYFRSDLTAVSEYLTQRCNRQHTYLILDKFSVQTTDYLTSDSKGNFNSPCSVPYRQVDPENSWQLSNLQKGDEIVFAQSSIFDIKKFKAYHKNAALILEKRNKFGQAVLAVYRIQ